VPGNAEIGKVQPSVAFAEDKVNSLSVVHDNHPGTVPQKECIFAFGRNLSAAYIPQSEGSRSEVTRLVIWRDFHQCPYVTKAFLGLAHDLGFADDFLTGTGALLGQAAKRESSDGAERNADLMAGYVGDKRKVEQLRSSFHQRRYEEAIARFNGLKYPERLSESDRKMVELARKRTRIS